MVKLSPSSTSRVFKYESDTTSTSLSPSPAESSIINLCHKSHVRYLWSRWCTYIGSDDSATWPPATADDFEPIPHLCRLILAVYEEDLHNPKFAPVGGYRLNPDCVIKRVTYQQTLGQAPPHLIYPNHSRREIVLAIGGLNLRKESDYKVLLNNRLGMQMFDGGYVHHGLLKSAGWLLNQESESLKRLGKKQSAVLPSWSTNLHNSTLVDLYQPSVDLHSSTPVDLHQHRYHYTLIEEPEKGKQQSAVLHSRSQNLHSFLTAPLLFVILDFSIGRTRNT
ncbi:hypothetical protein R6Q57_005126 [Mikania cordata]